MAMLVNIPPSGKGILSTKSANMTCTCDSSSCQCFHPTFHYTARHKVETISKYRGPYTFLPDILDRCSEQCMVGITMTMLVGIMVLSMACLAWRRRWVV